MPYPNEHAARLTDPKQYDKIRCKNDEFGQGIHAIYGIKDKKSELQSIRFDSSKFTVDQAKKWLKAHDHEPILFESATGGKTLEYRSRPFECLDLTAKSHEEGKDEKDDPGWIEGRLVIYDKPDLYREVIRPGCFTKSMNERVPAGKVKLMVRHFRDGGDSLDVIGTITEAKDTDKFMWIHAALSSVEPAQHVRKLIIEKHLQHLSVGYMPMRFAEISDIGDGKPGMELTEAKLLEGTVTTKPVAERAVITAAKALQDFVDSEGIHVNADSIKGPEPNWQDVLTCLDPLVKAVQGLTMQSKESSSTQVIRRSQKAALLKRRLFLALEC